MKFSISKRKDVFPSANTPSPTDYNVKLPTTRIAYTIPYSPKLGPFATKTNPKIGPGSYNIKSIFDKPKSQQLPTRTASTKVLSNPYKFEFASPSSTRVFIRDRVGSQSVSHFTPNVFDHSRKSSDTDPSVALKSMELGNPPSRQSNNLSPKIYQSQKFKQLQTIVDNEVKLSPSGSLSKRHKLDVSSSIGNDNSRSNIFKMEKKLSAVTIKSSNFRKESTSPQQMSMTFQNTFHTPRGKKIIKVDLDSMACLSARCSQMNKTKFQIKKLSQGDNIFGNLFSPRALAARILVPLKLD